MRFSPARSVLPLIALLAGLSPLARAEEPGTLVTYAGGGNGDGLPATSAPLQPHWIATDRDGNLLLSNGWLQRVDRTTGILTTLTGVRFNAGDFEDVQMDRTFPKPDAYASWIAVDSRNNIYFSDSYNNCVQKVGPDGIPACYAGSGVPGNEGDGGPAREASLSAPFGIAFDPQDNLYIVSRSAGKVRKVDPQGIITTYASGLDMPESIAVDATGTVYVASPIRHKVYRVATDGTVSVYAGNGPARRFAGDGGPALTASLFSPAGLAIDKDGNLLIADRDNDRIRKIDAATQIITTVAGIGGGHPYLNGEGQPYPDDAFAGDGGPATAARLFRPHGIYVEPSGRILIAEVNSFRVRAIDTDGTITTLFTGAGDGIPALQADLVLPTKLAVSPQNDLYIADRFGNRLRKVDGQGTITTAAGNGTSYYFFKEFPTAYQTSLADPSGVAPDFQGNIYFSDTFRVLKKDAQGNVTVVPGTDKLLEPRGIALDADRNLYIADFGGGAVFKVDAQGTITPIARLESVTGVAVDRHGNVFYCGLQLTVKKVDRAGNVTVVNGGGPLYDDRYDPPRPINTGYLSSMAVDSDDNLYLPTYALTPDGSSRIGSVVKFDKDGHVSVIAGGGTEFKEGAPATEQLLGDTRDVAIDGEGNLYLSDRDNQKVYKIFGAAAPGLIAGQSITLKIRPDAPTLTAGESSRLSIDGDLPVQWSVLSGEGSVDPDGTYHAPDDVTAPGTATVQAAATDGSGRTATVVITLEPKPFSPGDVNRDGAVDVSDAILVLQSVVGMTTLDAEQVRLGDMTGDGEIDVSDAASLLRLIVGIPNG